ncbi:tetratricopeptide repeat protein 33-like isoform X1 [Branchiostoma lanceolatum]|uniref:tetratricopeptide repeat protein 33-like isoform X1 n=2 Tax=Branchiostoma lanceolatum TaxID=7740 RepID=UPI0034517C9C
MSTYVVEQDIFSMTSFGWKRKVGENVTKPPSAFSPGEQLENEHEVNPDEVDWLHAVKIRRAVDGLLEDGLTKANRLKQEGCLLAESQRYWEAIRRWEDALELTPDDAALHEMKAQAYMEVHEVFPAVQAAEKAVTLDPRWWVAYQTLGRTQVGLGDLKLAISNFSKAIHLNPACSEELWEDDLKWACSLLEEKRELERKAEEEEKEGTAGVSGELDMEHDDDYWYPQLPNAPLAVGEASATEDTDAPVLDRYQRHLGRFQSRCRTSTDR